MSISSSLEKRNRMKKRQFVTLSLLLSGLLFTNPRIAKADPTENETETVSQVSAISEIDSIIEFIPGQHTAFDVYQDLIEASITLKAQAVTSPGSDSDITFGAEKEASSFLITKIMGPKKDFLKFLMTRENDLFKREFIKRFIGGSTRLRSVVDLNGVQHALKFEDISHLQKDIDQISGMEVNNRLEQLIDLLGESPYSHFTEAERKRLFKREAPHQTYPIGGDFGGYIEWTAIKGLPEKYIGSAHETSVGGWEINFAPMDTYGEFEGLIKWFRETLKNAGKLFQAPGHQRIVFPVPQFEHLEEAQEKAAVELWRQKTSEMFRAVQAYIIARGINGGTGIERGSYKEPINDADLVIGEGSLGSGSTGRGPIRYDSKNRFRPESLSIELRAGTKDASVQQFIEQTITARLAANQLGDLAHLNSYELYPQSQYELLEESYDFEVSAIEKLALDIQKRFGVKLGDAQRFVINTVSRENGFSSRHIFNIGYNIPIWHWTNAPFMKGKFPILKTETIRYIETVAKTKDPVVIKNALRTWTRNVRVIEALENYLRPKAVVENMAQLSHFKPTGEVDVNKVDLGIEYSGRFTNSYRTEMLPDRGVDGQQIWLNTTDGMTPYERRQTIKRMALALGKALNDGRAVPVIDATTAGAHGHGLSVAFNFYDKHGRKWRAEWDGVGRNYTAEGKVVPGSQRGGHIEIVTPKFNPTYEEISAVYTAMENEGIIPSLRAGGGHINIDLAPFIGKPRELARFLAIFHEHRGILSFMFQNINRSAAAEAVEISEKLRQELMDFNGTETELKQLLYNERYFNQRLGRKTRNMQIDMSAYFQDVIPAKHIHEDFDMKNPTDPWREQFRVDPRIRKMEMRMFDAPLDAFESSMQIKVVRALMNAALNETSPVSGKVQAVDHIGYANNFEKAQSDLEKLAAAIGLEAKDFKIFLSRAAIQAKEAASGKFFRTYEQKIELYGWKKSMGGWGEALTYARSSSRAIGSAGRHWNGTPSAMAEEFRATRVEAARDADEARRSNLPSERTRPALQMSVNCRQVFGL